MPGKSQASSRGKQEASKEGLNTSAARYVAVGSCTAGNNVAFCRICLFASGNEH